MYRLFVSYPQLFLFILAIGGYGYTETLSPEYVKSRTSAKLLEEAENAVKMMQDILKNSLNLLKAAKEANDISQMQCINENLPSIKGYLRLSEQNLVSLREKVAIYDRAGVENEYVKIMFARGKMEELDERVKSCVGLFVEGIIEGRPVVLKEFEEDLPVEDPLLAIEILGVELDTPESASPLF